MADQHEKSLCEYESCLRSKELSNVDDLPTVKQQWATIAIKAREHSNHGVQRSVCAGVEFIERWRKAGRASIRKRRAGNDNMPAKRVL